MCSSTFFLWFVPLGAKRVADLARASVHICSQMTHFSLPFKKMPSFKGTAKALSKNWEGNAFTKNDLRCSRILWRLYCWRDPCHAKGTYPTEAPITEFGGISSLSMVHRGAGVLSCPIQFCRSALQNISLSSAKALRSCLGVMEPLIGGGGAWFSWLLHQ